MEVRVVWAACAHQNNNNLSLDPLVVAKSVDNASMPQSHEV
jgi:hypothetical protein